MMNTQIDITKNGITTLNTVGKYCDRNIDINVNVPVPLMEVHKITLPNDLTTGYHTILKDSEFVKEHRNKDGFMLSLTALTPATVGKYAVGFAYACNRPLVSQDNNSFSALSFRSATTVRDVKTNNHKANESQYSTAVPYANDGGNVLVNPSADYPLLAGEYLLMMAVIEPTT